MLELGSWLDPAYWQQILKKTVEWAIQAVPAVLLVLLLAFVLLRLLRFVCRKIEQTLIRRGHAGDAKAAREYEKRSETLLGIVSKAGTVAIWVLVVMLVLVQLGINVAPLIAGAGIAGLAIGFGAQELVRDVISGFFILLENQIRNGDVVLINGTGGLVESVGLRTVTLRDEAGVVHVFQNGKINTLANMTKEWSAMVFSIGVAYKEDTDKVAEVMKEVADQLQADPAMQSKILAPIEIFGVDAFDESAVIVKGRIKTQPIEQWSVGREYRRLLKKAFDARGIEIPFPHRTITWGDASPPFKVEARSSNGTAGRENGSHAGRGTQLA